MMTLHTSLTVTCMALIFCSSLALSLPSSGADDYDDNDRSRRQRKTDNILDQLNHYDVVVPSLVDSNGQHISHGVTHSDVTRTMRYRRDTASGTNSNASSSRGSNEIYYKFNAFGRHYHLNLTYNRYLLSPSYQSELWDADGAKIQAKQQSRSLPCHYVGHVTKSQSSLVALSNCHGLQGVIKTDDEELFVEPLWNATRDAAIGNSLGQHPHLVYRRSGFKSAEAAESYCGVKDKVWKPKSHHFNDVLKSQVYTQQSRHHRRKRSTSKERYVETLIVADKKMVFYHGKEEIEPYILTVMNIVSNLYYHASIGNSINIVVTRLILLTEEQPQLIINHHADRTLESFCRWQYNLNGPGKTGGVAHHDTAILLTRYDICTYKNEPCSTLGLAQVGGICESDRSCSINEDTGLATAFTVAHELGHTFGMQHDGSGYNRCDKTGAEASRLMAAQLTTSTDLFGWSICSNEYITLFLDSGGGKCLDNVPQTTDFPYPEDLPGQTHDADQQCRLQFHSRSQSCKLSEICRELWCTDFSGECKTNRIPAADGTTCKTKAAKKGWCYEGQCIKFGWIPEKVHGGWGEWSNWGECSRTCGGGVELSQRFCDSPKPMHGGKYCLGERKRFRTCNIQECPANFTDFRELQCAQYNSVPFRDRYYKWVPFVGAQVRPCALNCMAIGMNFYTERSPKVVDGTRCNGQTLDMCVNGECQHVGCDYVLGSDAKEDSCRVCGGDGSTCDKVTGIFDSPVANKSGSYYEFLRIPAGSVHIKIKELQTSKNYIALKSTSDKFFLNGALNLDWSRKFTAADTVFAYDRPDDGPEELTALGPTSQELIALILVQESNSGIGYEYFAPRPNATNRAVEYIWDFETWTPCSLTCARGLSKSVAVCMKKDDRQVVKPSLCRTLLRPPDKVKSCNEQPCPVEWVIGEWSACSRTCGGGERTRRVQCVQRIQESEVDVLNPKMCVGKRPRARQRCNEDKKCPTRWNTDEWTTCTPECGLGTQSRNVFCVNLEGKHLADDSCVARMRPPSQQQCTNGPCPPPDWLAGPWSECSAPCGQGQQLRNVTCHAHDGELSDDCSDVGRPADSQQCEGSCEIDETFLSTECKDINKVQYCPLVLKFKFCSRAYFRQMCCKTCTEAGF